jgi:sulfiredoxin
VVLRVAGRAGRSREKPGGPVASDRYGIRPPAQFSRPGIATLLHGRNAVLGSGIAPQRRTQRPDGHRIMLKKQAFPIAEIHVPVKRLKLLDTAKVQELAESILEDGQTTPIRLRAGKGRFVLLEGLHRLEALKALGEDTVEGYLVHARLH